MCEKNLYWIKTKQNSTKFNPCTYSFGFTAQYRAIFSLLLGIHHFCFTHAQVTGDWLLSSSNVRKLDGYSVLDIVGFFIAPVSILSFYKRTKLLSNVKHIHTWDGTYLFETIDWWKIWTDLINLYNLFRSFRTHWFVSYWMPSSCVVLQFYCDQLDGTYKNMK